MDLFGGELLGRRVAGRLKLFFIEFGEMAIFKRDSF
jgi:hypothetical protein